MKKKIVLIFDFDGVILDSVNIKTEGFKKLFEKESKENIKKIINYHLNNGGISRIKKIKYFYRNYLGKKINSKQLNILAKKFKIIILNKILKCNFIKGSHEFLRKNKKYICYISSGTPEKELKNICKKRKLNTFFKSIYGSPKTKINHINKIKKKNSKNTLYIFLGDSNNDIKAAKKTNIKFILVGNGISKKFNVKYKIKNLLSLNKIINQINVVN